MDIFITGPGGDKHSFEISLNFTAGDLLKIYEKNTKQKYNGKLRINDEIMNCEKSLGDYDLNEEIKYVPFLELKGKDLPPFQKTDSYQNEILIQHDMSMKEAIMLTLNTSSTIVSKFNLFDEFDDASVLKMMNSNRFYEIGGESWEFYQANMEDTKYHEELMNKYNCMCVKHINHNFIPTITENKKLKIEHFQGHIDRDMICERMKKHGVICAGSFVIANIVDNIKFQDIDFFSYSLDFLRWMLKELHYKIESTHNIDCEQGSKFTSYKIGLFHNICTINFIHMQKDDEDLGDLYGREEDQEKLMQDCSSRFDISCCCSYWDGDKIYYHPNTLNRIAYYKDSDNFNEIKRYDLNYRLDKYKERGFNIYQIMID